MNKPVSVVILTKNPGRRFGTVLDKIFDQSFRDFEVIVIDSGSSNSALDIIRKYPVSLVRIKPSGFGHGRTRNLGASLAKGEFVVFLTQDAVPKDRTWLKELLKSFNDSKVVACYGRQFPLKKGNTFDNMMRSILYKNKRIERTFGSYSFGDNILSNSNSAIRKSLLLKYPFKKDIIVGEDYEWADRIMYEDYKVVYEPKAAVIHPHSYDLFSLFRANFDIGVSYAQMRKSNGNIGFIKKGAKTLSEEIGYLNNAGKIYLLPELIIRDLVRLVALYLGKNEKIFPEFVKRNYLSAQRWYWK